MGSDDWSGRACFFRVTVGAMKSLLSTTGTAALLEAFSPHIPDLKVRVRDVRPISSTGNRSYRVVVSR
jgi:hypothetical protein